MKKMLITVLLILVGVFFGILAMKSNEVVMINNSSMNSLVNNI